MRIIIIINSHTHPFHEQVAKRLQNALEARGNCETKLIDLKPKLLSEGTHSHSLISEIRKAHAQLLVTLDLAGFEMRNTMETASYNVIHCRMAHLLLGEYKEYEQWLGEPMNFSMFFMAGEELCRQIRQKHPQIENVLCAEWITQLSSENDYEAIVQYILSQTEVEQDFI